MYCSALQCVVVFCSGFDGHHQCTDVLNQTVYIYIKTSLVTKVEADKSTILREKVFWLHHRTDL